MSPYRPQFAPPKDAQGCRWICHHCGESRDYSSEIAYPVCECGRRMRILDVDGMPYVTSPQLRLEAARREHEEVYERWRALVARLKVALEHGNRDAERWGWDFDMPAAAHAVNATAIVVDRATDEVAQLQERLAAAGQPRRIQLRRGRGWRKPPGAVVVSRPSKWGNPFPVDVHGRTEAVRLYRAHLEQHPELVEEARRELAGRDLACWCRRGLACHADVLLEVVNCE